MCYTSWVNNMQQIVCLVVERVSVGVSFDAVETMFAVILFW